MCCNWGHIISFWGDIINLWGHIISFWGHIISFWGRYPYWGQGSIGGKIIILWGDFELGARLLTYGGISLTFWGVIINYILRTTKIIFHEREQEVDENQPCRPCCACLCSPSLPPLPSEHCHFLPSHPQTCYGQRNRWR